jgi:hypothetical protein
MSTSKRTGWECRFCSENLKPQSLIGWRRLLWIVPVRTFRCPHCFHTFQKPVAIVAAIPLVGKLFCEKRRLVASVSKTISGVVRRGKSSRRDHVHAGRIVRFGRWAGKVESGLSGLLGKVFRTLLLQVLWPFHWFSKNLPGSGDWSSPTYRSKSGRRSRTREHDEH